MENETQNNFGEQAGEQIYVTAAHPTGLTLQAVSRAHRAPASRAYLAADGARMAEHIRLRIDAGTSEEQSG